MLGQAWFRGGGWQHDEQLVRAATYALTGGAQGVGELDDLHVTAQSTPNGTVKVSTGTATINALVPNVQQAYITRFPSGGTITVAPTAGTPRSDAIIVRIDDPAAAGSQATAHKIEVTAVPCPASTTHAGQLNLPSPAYMLARVDIPANTSAITQAMIKDMRAVGRPRREVHKFHGGLVAGDAEEFITSTTGTHFMASKAQHMVDIPAWATFAYVDCNVAQLGMRADNAAAGGKAVATFAVSIGTTTDVTGVNQYRTDNTYLHEDGKDHRCSAILSQGKPLPAALRGTKQRVSLEARKWTGVGESAKFVAVAGTQVSMTVEFVEKIL